MPPLTFRSEDEEAQYCLSALRDGTHEEKIVARERLAAIFARRGLYDEAAELYELNIRAGVRSPEVFEDLAILPPSRRPGERRGSPRRSAARVRSRAQRQPAQASAPRSPPRQVLTRGSCHFRASPPHVSLSTRRPGVGPDRTRLSAASA